MTLSLWSVNSVNAQSFYHEEDYDDYYGNDDYYYNESPYARYNNLRGGGNREEERYRSSVKEERLYNGGYKVRNQDQGNWGTGTSGYSNVNRKTNKNGSSSSEQPVRLNKPGRFDVGTQKEGTINIYPPSDRFLDDGEVSKADPGNGEMSGPPPPPDETDIPVDTAIPLLIAAGVGLASFKYIAKNKKETSTNIIY